MVVFVVFAVISGIFTALMAIYTPENTSFHEIAVFFEAWNAGGAPTRDSVP